MTQTEFLARRTTAADPATARTNLWIKKLHSPDVQWLFVLVGDSRASVGWLSGEHRDGIEVTRAAVDSTDVSH